MAVSEPFNGQRNSEAQHQGCAVGAASVRAQWSASDVALPLSHRACILSASAHSAHAFEGWRRVRLMHPLAHGVGGPPRGQRMRRCKLARRMPLCASSECTIVCTHSARM